ncbi:hypothetical protein TNIN_97811, partial [Trichonephila inaurata madagascariensis]
NICVNSVLFHEYRGSDGCAQGVRTCRPAPQPQPPVHVEVSHHPGFPDEYLRLQLRHLHLGPFPVRRESSLRHEGHEETGQGTVQVHWKKVLNPKSNLIGRIRS